MKCDQQDKGADSAPLPREVMNVPSLELFKAGLDGALSGLV